MWVTNPYLAAATSDNTRKAYRSDIKHYEQSGGILPATPEQIIYYLQHFAATLNSRTLARRLIAIKHWHQYQGFPDLTVHPLVTKTMIGILCAWKTKGQSTSSSSRRFAKDGGSLIA